MKILRKTVFVAILLKSLIFFGQEPQMSEPTHFIPYKNLKEYYGNNLNVSYQNAPKKVKSEVRKIEDMNVNLYSKTSNGSPFINSKASVGENATRLYFEPNESRYKDIYLGALFNETQIKGSNVKNWKSFNQENIYLVGKVSSSNVIGLNPKNVFFAPTSNHTKDATFTNQADNTEISGVYSSSDKSNEIQVDLGAGYGPVSVDMSYSTSTSISNSNLSVVLVAKVFTLDATPTSIQATSKDVIVKDYLQNVHPSKKPMYVSSIDYGFAIVADINTSSLSESQKAALSAKVELGLKSGKAGFDYGSAFANSNVNVTFKYYGVTPSTTLAGGSYEIQNVVSLMQREARNYMAKLSSQTTRPIPLSCKFTYLYPKNLNESPDDVFINDILLKNQYFAVGIPQVSKAQLPAQVNATINYAFMNGIPKGWGLKKYGECFMDISGGSKDREYESYWYFYLTGYSDQNISKKAYENRGKDSFTISKADVNSNDEFYIWVRLRDKDCTPEGTDIVMNKWTKSITPIKVSDVLARKKIRVYFFNEVNKDFYVDLSFNY